MEAEDAVSYEGDEAVGNENEEELANSFGYDVIVEDSKDSQANLGVDASPVQEEQKAPVQAQQRDTKLPPSNAE